MMPSDIIHSSTSFMGKVILKSGDRVLHKSFGQGIVTNADDEFCTVKFETKEAMFRLPEAFEEGFLTSEDATILDDEEDVENEMEVDEEEELIPEEQKNVVVNSKDSDSEKKSQSKTSVTAIIVAIVMGVIFIPIAVSLFEVGAEYDEIFFYIIGAIFCCAPLVGFFFGRISSGSTSNAHSYYHFETTDSGSDSEPMMNFNRRHGTESSDERIRREIYAKQDEDLAILEDMIQMHSVNPDADLESHYGWEHKIDYDQDGDNDDW